MLRSALRSLAAREHSARELTDKLARKFGDAGLAAETVARLRRDGLQSDGRFAEAFVLSRAGRLGAERIRRELADRGIGRDLAASATAGLDDEDTAAAHALGALRSRHPGGLRTEAERARGHRFLAARGFPGRVARRALDMHRGTEGD